MMKYFTGTRVSVLWIFICSPLLTYAVHPGLTAKIETGNSILTPVFMQQNVIQGKVLDDTGVGMPGVNVIIKGTSNGTTTDVEGAYRLTLSSDQAGGPLVFSFIGYTTQEQPINNRSSINVTIAADVSELSEVVVVGG